MSLPSQLRVLRARKGLTLIDAAREIGISRDTLSDLERGKRHPIMPTLRRIADFYGVPVEELLEEGGDEEITPEEWSREKGARLHGMETEEWDEYVRTHDTVDELHETYRELLEESKMLHAAWNMEKAFGTRARKRRHQIWRGVRQTRIHRLGDLHTAALMKHAEQLVNEIFEAMEREALEEA